jgi:thiamine biosynthesis lipoprotein
VSPLPPGLAPGQRREVSGRDLRLDRVGVANRIRLDRPARFRSGVDRPFHGRRVLGPERWLVIAFRSMGCDVVLSDGRAETEVRALFSDRDQRFSRFVDDSELNAVNARPLGVAILSAEFAELLALAIRVARSTAGLVTPAVGAAVEAAGYDRDFAQLPGDGELRAPVRVPDLDALALRGRVLLRTSPVLLDLNGVVKGKTVDDALELQEGGWVSAGGDLATTVPVQVGLPSGGTILLREGGLATSSVAVRTWTRGGARQHHLIDPATGRPARSPWRDVTVAAQNCVAADVAAKAALLCGSDGPEWLDRRSLPGRFVDGRGAVHVNEAWRAAVPEPLAA